MRNQRSLTASISLRAHVDLAQPPRARPAHPPRSPPSRAAANLRNQSVCGCPRAGKSPYFTGRRSRPYRRCDRLPRALGWPAPLLLSMCGVIIQQQLHSSLPSTARPPHISALLPAPQHRRATRLRPSSPFHCPCSPAVEQRLALRRSFLTPRASISHRRTGPA